MDTLGVCQFYSIIPSKKSEATFSTSKSRIFKPLIFSTFTEELTCQLLLHEGDFSDITLRMEGGEVDSLNYLPHQQSSIIPSQLMLHLNTSTAVYQNMKLKMLVS